MKGLGIWIFLAAIVIAAAIVWVAKGSSLWTGSMGGGSQVTVDNGSSPAESAPAVVEQKPVTIVALYQAFGATLVLRSSGKGVVSGSCFGEGSTFDWSDTGQTIELTNWNWSAVDGGKSNDGKGTCVKDGGSIQMCWKEKGILKYARLYQKRLE